jgi:hypothetical protein
MPTPLTDGSVIQDRYLAVIPKRPSWLLVDAGTQSGGHRWRASFARYARAFRHLAIAALASAALGGCAGAPIELTEGVPPASVRIELTNVPFHPQTEYHCGPAALATVLGDAGLSVAPEMLTERIYVPGRQGSLQVEMMAAARRTGRVAYPVAGRLDALYREVAAGHPVLVLQDLSFGLAPTWHYAVLVGFDRSANTVILRSGTKRRLIMPTRLFLRTWERAGRWGLVTLRPGRLPAEVDRKRYLSAVAPLERVGQFEAAASAWEAALVFWPTDLTALIGLGNAHHAKGDVPAAIDALERAVEHHPASGAAHNNLAFLLSVQGAHDRALRHASEAVRLGGPDNATYRETLREVRANSAS